MLGLKIAKELDVLNIRIPFAVALQRTTAAIAATRRASRRRSRGALTKFSAAQVANASVAVESVSAKSLIIVVISTTLSVSLAITTRQPTSALDLLYSRN